MPIASTNSPTPPRYLPSELEREIFLRASPQDICSLLLVARRVHDWVEAPFYQFIALTREDRACRLLSCLQLRPQFATTTIKSFWINGGVHIKTIAEILQITKSLNNLTLWPPPYPLSAHSGSDSDALLLSLNDLPLTNLSLALSLIPTISNAEGRDSVFLPSTSVFARITHLQLLDG
ncbi:hypothetical protein BV22DRAFT_1199651 [Leucogyrophana mollusca]|uniref:Uncharacterized protein n=1 Tax=Leucogyrophana mollusca TaxID=85980 RepID=A0ACB8B011_9AGAM|nr:hypothetical protein BV22DRAFT_1199651 [Leucogyrophana mollusca]